MAQPPALSVEYKVKFPTRNRKRKKSSPTRKPLRKLPHVTRLLALAYHLQVLIDESIVSDYADIARLSDLTRARLSQIMNLTLLAPKIQEEILGFTKSSFIDIREHNLREILKLTAWQEQYRVWKRLKSQAAACIATK